MVGNFANNKNLNLRWNGVQYLGYFGPEVLVLLWVLQEVDKLQDLHFGLLTAGDIFKLHIDVVLYHFCSRLPHVKGPSPPTPGASTHWSSPHVK